MYEETGDLYDGSIEVVESGHLPNCFMVLAGDFETIGGFDEKYVVMYEEADFSYRMQKATGKKCLVDLRAHTYHNTELAVTSGGVAHSPVYIFPSTDRAFLTARNRVYFMRKNVSFIQYSIFVFFYLPQIFLFYQFHMLISKKFKMAYRYLLGTLRGFVL